MIFSTQSFDRHDISTLTFWQLHRKYLWQFVTVIIYSTKKLMDIRIALRMIWTTKVWHIQDALCKPESFRSIHRLGNKSPAPTMLEAAWHFFHLLSTAKQVESRTADAALKPRHLLETIPPASAVYNMMSLTSASQCPHWILHRLDQERKDFLNGWHDPQLRHPSSSLKAKLWHIWHAAWQCLAKSEENPYRRLVKWLPAYSKSPSSKRGNFL